ncbi:hypothetical protein HDG40_006499 [Paraburkholderia sp. JPY158]|uniref:DUF2933 domain-containing protein n=1 Tax=Paraburkholderia atlantica TaxID=2654982 RepID=A0A7W8QD98_PARAM|nr:DUF2933 domain-containing protein [Paraburkholderia atlantica]MBB5428312.1 hypothetical protein [Paraburkholderia atlantica]
MKCDTKTMAAVAVICALALVVAYWALPQLRGSLTTPVVAVSALACPLSMLLMMRSMHSHVNSEPGPSPAMDEVKSQSRSSS